MQTLQEYKCPCCGGAIAFDSTLQKMKCPFCGTEFEMDALKSYDAELQGEQADNMEWETSAGSEWQESEIEGLRSYVCKSCGGEIVGDANTAATSCPFCGNPVVMMNQFAGLLKPDIVIPFKLDKKAAKAGLMKHLNGKKLLPKIFKDQNHIDEVKGVYVTFWLFDTDVDAQVRYRATKVRTWSDEDYRYTETSYYMIHRGGSVGFEHVPVDGSSKMPDDLMESVEPYDYSDALDFQTAYLAGYFADKYDVTAEESIDRANQRVRRSTEDAFASTVQGYATVNAESSSVQFHGGKAKYALYPVWLLNTTWNGEKYTFAMNGQTGKFVGNLPLDKSAATKWTVGLAAALSAAACGIAWLLHFAGILYRRDNDEKENTCDDICPCPLLLHGYPGFCGGCGRLCKRIRARSGYGEAPLGKRERSPYKNARRAQRTSENGCNSRDDQYVGRQKAHGICRRYL